MPLRSSLRSRAASYLAVLRIPHARRTFLSALVGRFSYGIVFLSLVLTITSATGSYAVAGTVIALFGISSAVLAPYRARLIDRYGLRRALLPMAASYAGLLGVLAAVTWQPGAPQAVLWVLGTLCGACTPPLGPVMRTLWGVLVPAEGELLQRAYSLDTVVEELLYVVGPLLAGLFTAFANPALGIALSAVLVLTGTLALVSSPVAQEVGAQQKGTPGPRRSPGRKGPRGWGRGLWSGTGLLDPVIITGGLGMCLGALNLLSVAFAGLHGGTAMVAWVSATMAVSSAIGGLVYGALSWRVSNRVRMPYLAAGLCLFVAPAGFSGNMTVLIALVAGAGLFVSPVLATAYLTAHEATTSGSRTESGTWVNTAFNAGNSAGVAGIGLLLSFLPLALCFTLAGAMLLIPAVLVGSRLLWRHFFAPQRYASAARDATINGA